MKKSYIKKLQDSDTYWWIGPGLIALFIFVGAMAPVMTYAAMVVSFSTACFLGYLAIKRPGIWMGKTVIVLLCLQNLCIGVGAHIAGNTDESLKLLTQIPFMTIFVIWIIGTIADFKLDKPTILFILLLACIALSLLSGHGSIQACLVSVRNMTVFYMAYCIGVRMVRDKDDLSDYIRFFLITAMIMCILGIIFMAGGYDLYRTLGVHEVYIAKVSPFAQGRLDDRFLRFMNGKFVQRLASIYYEPVNVAYLFASAVLCALFNNPFKNRIYGVLAALLSILGLTLTIGKGGYLLVIMPLCCLMGEWLVRKVFRIDNNKCSDSTLLFSMIIFAFAGVAVVTVLLVLYWEGRELIMPHIRGVIGAMNSVVKRPLGYGIGTGGNAAFVFNENLVDESQWYSVGGETALMSFIYQIGIHGIIIFMMCVVSTGLRKIIRMKNFEKIIFCLPWTLICAAVLQDNTFTPQCVVPFMLLIGGTRSAYVTDKEY